MPAVTRGLEIRREACPVDFERGVRTMPESCSNSTSGASSSDHGCNLPSAIVSEPLDRPIDERTPLVARPCGDGRGRARSIAGPLLAFRAHRRSKPLMSFALFRRTRSPEAVNHSGVSPRECGQSAMIAVHRERVVYSPASSTLCDSALLRRHRDPKERVLRTRLAPEEGFEPPTRRLTAACSTTELLRKIYEPVDVHHEAPGVKGTERRFRPESMTFSSSTRQFGVGSKGTPVSIVARSTHWTRVAPSKSAKWWSVETKETPVRRAPAKRARVRRA